TVEIGTEQERETTEGDARGDGQGSQQSHPAGCAREGVGEQLPCSRLRRRGSSGSLHDPLRYLSGDAAASAVAGASSARSAAHSARSCTTSGWATSRKRQA